MNIRQDDFDYLKRTIDAVVSKYGKDYLIKKYESGDFINSKRVTDLQRRFCWDLIGLGNIGTFVNKTLHAYLGENEIYSALLEICPKVQRRY